jgi:8-oxo-dGTP pyrophosphatase MutT (NUDIX family)
LTISYNNKSKYFNLRSAAIICRGNKILLTREPPSEVWFLLGGKVEFFENTKATLERELQEELNESVAVGKQLGVSEDFFSFQGKSVHEVTFVYEVKLLKESSIMQLKGGDVFSVKEGDSSKIIDLSWYSIDELRKLSLLPPKIGDFLEKKIVIY